MREVDRWLLPDGIEEMLPEEASQVEDLRRKLVNLFKQWGYDYVIPPMLEFCDSLLTGSGEDISLLTFKLTDQLSGKMMGLRADITPQVARMDAHSLKRDGINRLCYAGHVAHTRAKEPLSSRTPIQVGVELFGDSGTDADIEVVSLLLSTLEVAGLPEQYIDLGHVGIFRSLSQYAGLNTDQEVALFKLLQAKAMTELNAWLAAEVSDPDAQRWLLKLPQLSGGAEILDEALERFEGAPVGVLDAVKELKRVASQVSKRYPEAKMYFDLSELRGYHYLTGIVFGAFAPGAGTAIGRGGRYDHIGEAFGRARPARGFAVDITAIRRLVAAESAPQVGIFVPAQLVSSAWSFINDKRKQGERVVCGLTDQTRPQAFQACDRILVERNGSFDVELLEKR